jgi:hypothetical protein
MQKIIVTKFIEQTKRKEQLESGKSGEKSHNEGKKCGKGQDLIESPKDSPT